MFYFEPMTHLGTCIFLKYINETLWTCTMFSEIVFCFDFHWNVTNFVGYAVLLPIANNRHIANSSEWLRLRLCVQFSLFCSCSPSRLPHFHTKMFLLCFVIQNDSMTVLMHSFYPFWLEFWKQPMHYQINQTLQFSSSRQIKNDKKLLFTVHAIIALHSHRNW